MKQHNTNPGLVSSRQHCFIQSKIESLISVVDVVELAPVGEGKSNQPQPTAIGAMSYGVGSGGGAKATGGVQPGDQYTLNNDPVPAILPELLKLPLLELNVPSLDNVAPL